MATQNIDLNIINGFRTINEADLNTISGIRTINEADLNNISGIRTINEADLNSFQFNNMLNGYLASAFPQQLEPQTPSENIPQHPRARRESIASE